MCNIVVRLRKSMLLLVPPLLSAVCDRRPRKVDAGADAADARGFGLSSVYVSLFQYCTKNAPVAVSFRVF